MVNSVMGLALSNAELDGEDMKHAVYSLHHSGSGHRHDRVRELPTALKMSMVVNIRIVGSHSSKVIPSTSRPHHN